MLNWLHFLYKLKAVATATMILKKKYCSLNAGPLAWYIDPEINEIKSKYMVLTFHIDTF